MPLQVELQRDPQQEPQDAGHLGIQELVLRLGRRAGTAACSSCRRSPTEPWRSIDVGLADDRRRRLIVVECWNTIGDIGAAARTSTRKLAEAEALAALRWGDRPHTTGLVWVVRATARNRELVARYPEVFAARFPGSSAGWVARPQRRHGAARRAGPGLGERRRHQDLPLATPLNRRGRTGRRPGRPPALNPAGLDPHPPAPMAMDHRDHVALIRAGVAGAGRAGSSSAAARARSRSPWRTCSGRAARSPAVDRDARALAPTRPRRRPLPGRPSTPRPGDFTDWASRPGRSTGSWPPTASTSSPTAEPLLRGGPRPRSARTAA